MNRDEKRTWIVVRTIAGAIGIIVLYLMFVHEPKSSQTDKFVTETMWEAVHPYHWLWDTLGVIGMTFYFMYVTGLAGKAVYEFTGQKAENSSGLVHVVFAVSLLFHIFFYI
jgi:hypothetical protein